MNVCFAAILHSIPHTHHRNNNNDILRPNNFESEIGLKEGRSKAPAMVISGKGRSGGDRETEKEDMERLKRLHNFDLPYLKWGNQKLLRCLKVDSNRDDRQVPVVDRNQTSDSGGGGGAAVVRTRRKDSEIERPIRSSDGDRTTERNCKVLSSEKVKVRFGVAGDSARNGVGDGEIYATREKLMLDFQKEVGEMKDAILGERLVDPPPAAAATTATTTINSPEKRPWNLRTRRTASKAPRSPSNNNGEIVKPNSSPVRNESEYPKLRHTNGLANATTGGEKVERPKFSICLTRREVEEDFTAMSGRRLPRKPKKRPRIVQRQLDTLFPGLWLSEITADLYKVPDDTETRKR